MTGARPAPSHTKRVEKFGKSLVNEIPLFPNDKASLQALEQKHLTDLLITYFNWKIRLVAPRLRAVTIAQGLTSAALEILEGVVNLIGIEEAASGGSLPRLIRDRELQ